FDRALGRADGVLPRAVVPRASRARRLGAPEQPLDGPRIDPAVASLQAHLVVLSDDGRLITEQPTQSVNRARQREACRVTLGLGPERLAQLLLACAALARGNHGLE